MEMKDFIASLTRKNKSQNQQNFTRLMTERERIIIYFSANSEHTFEIFSYLVSWKELFTEIICIIPNYSFMFFKRLNLPENFTIINQETDLKPFNNSVIFNFYHNKQVTRNLKLSQNSAIIDIENPSNLQFFPIPDSPVSLFTNFARFFNFPIQKSLLKLELTIAEENIATHRFIKNRFPNYILDINKSSSQKINESVVTTLKQNFSANIYLTGRTIKKKNFINIEDIEYENLFDLFILARECDMFITDNLGLAKIFSQLEVKLICLDKNEVIEGVKSIDPEDVSELKNSISSILKKDANIEV
jgi:hypothetical protein